eukprot:63408-Chlamydomonas_euryale.AAC.2
MQARPPRRRSPYQSPRHPESSGRSKTTPRPVDDRNRRGALRPGRGPVGGCAGRDARNKITE